MDGVGMFSGIAEFIERATKERLLQEERELIKDFQATGKVEAKGAVAAIDELRIMLPAPEDKTNVLIVNATTAAAIRKQLGEEPGIRLIITAAADTGTVYQVTDDKLKKQLLRVMAGRSV